MTEIRRAQLYCLGCGRPICTAEPGKLLAISCACGAYSPILVAKGMADVASMPVSFLEFARENLVGPKTPAVIKEAMTAAGFKRASPPHWEFWLGYSDHMSPFKEQLLAMLKEAGSTSQADCPEPKCKKAYTRGLEHWQELEARIKMHQVGEV